MTMPPVNVQLLQSKELIMYHKKRLLAAEVVGEISLKQSMHKAQCTKLDYVGYIFAIMKCVSQLITVHLL